jgi:guanylate kinase
MTKGALFVISAPSGAGKSTLIERIRPRFPDMLYSVSCTTRPPRSGEVEGIHYYFLSEERFRDMILRNEFLEWKEVHGNLYGTPAGPVRSALDAGLRMILDIDVQGACDVFARIPEAVGIFINAPDMETLKERLRARGTDPEETISIRLANATEEIAQGCAFPYRIVNDDLDRAVEALAAIIVRHSEGRGALLRRPAHDHVDGV